jgi:GNAT superfamily N-acetyltransferase
MGSMNEIDTLGSRSGGYPTELSCDVQTRDGARLHLRPIRPGDASRLREFHAGLSPLSVYRRFFFMHPRLTEAEIEHFTHVDYRDRLALVVTDGDQLVAVGRYDRISGTVEAEVAFVVADALQHHGIGPLLLEHLARAAVKNGITTFVAQTLAENHDMLDVFIGSGFPMTTSTEYGTVSLRFPIRHDDATAEPVRG